MLIDQLARRRQASQVVVITNSILFVKRQRLNGDLIQHTARSKIDVRDILRR